MREHFTCHADLCLNADLRWSDVPPASAFGGLIEYQLPTVDRASIDDQCRTVCQKILWS
jgi:hypothetical protein